jgi:hypothetical protein
MSKLTTPGVPKFADHELSIRVGVPNFRHRLRNVLRIGRHRHHALRRIDRIARAGPALPTRSPMARARREQIRSPSQGERRRRVYQPVVRVARDRAECQPRRGTTSIVCRHVQPVASTGARMSIVRGASVKDVGRFCVIVRLRFVRKFTFCVISRQFAEGSAKWRIPTEKAELGSHGRFQT